jgi:hypothetical protein
MSHVATVTTSIEYELESEVMTPTWDDEHLTFVGEYERIIDEDGYYPPKFLVNDGAIYDIAHEALASANLWDKFRTGYYVKAEQHDDVGIETIYTSPCDLGEAPLAAFKIVSSSRRVNSETTKGDKKSPNIPIIRKRTRYTVRIRKSRRCKKLTPPPPLPDESSQYCESCDSECSE